MSESIKRIVLEAGHRADLLMRIYQLAEQYHVGSPLELYNMQPTWIHFCQMLRRVLLGAAICMMLFIVVVIALFLYQYFIVYRGQMPDLQERVILGLPGIIIGLLGSSICLMIRAIIVQIIPASLLICTEGLLEIRPNQIRVTFWNEVNGSLQECRSGTRRSYKLYRINRKPLLFGENFENIEELASLIKQRTELR